MYTFRILCSLSNRTTTITEMTLRVCSLFVSVNWNVVIFKVCAVYLSIEHAVFRYFTSLRLSFLEGKLEVLNFCCFSAELCLYHATNNYGTAESSQW